MDEEVAKQDPVGVEALTNFADSDTAVGKLNARFMPAKPAVDNRRMSQQIKAMDDAVDISHT